MFQLYLKHEHSSNPQRQKRRLYEHDVSTDQDCAVFGVPQTMTLNRASELFKCHIAFRSTVTDLIEAFLERESITAFDISVHYRGTDKIYEAPQAEIGRTLDAVENLIRQIPAPRIFIATDTPAFLEAARHRFVNGRILFFEYGINPDPTRPRHFSQMAPREKALDALVNILLLSRAPLMVRTSSYFSAWSRILNPTMRQMTLNEPNGAAKFPEKQLLEESLGCI